MCIFIERSLYWFCILAIFYINSEIDYLYINKFRNLHLNKLKYLIIILIMQCVVNINVIKKYLFLLTFKDCC